MDVASAEESRARSVEVLIVDDHRVFGDAMCLAVNLEPGMVCHGAVPSPEVALEWMAERCVDVVLIGVEVPGEDGLTAISELRGVCPKVRVIFLTADATAQTLLDAVADGFLPTGFPLARVLRAVRDVEHDVTEPMSPNRAVRQAHELSRGGNRRPDLTEREYEILLLLADGLPVKQVARRLEMSVNTCRGHVASLLRKLEVHSQLAAVVTAARLGMLPNLRADPQV